MQSRLRTLGLGAVAVAACSACVLGQVAFSPDDARIAAVVQGLDDAGKERQELWVTDLATLQSRLVTAAEHVGPSPGWSRGGDALHYLLLPEEGNGHRLQRWDGAASETVATFDLDDDLRLFAVHPPAFSPDGRLLYITHLDAEEQTPSILRRDLLSGETRVLQANAGGPSVSPDGKYVACHLLRGEHEVGLGVLSASTGEPVTETPSHAKINRVAIPRPEWSRDGRQLAFVAGRPPTTDAPDAGDAPDQDEDDRTELVLLDVQSGAIRRGLTAQFDEVAFPYWSRSGERIYYTGWTKADERRRPMSLDVATGKSDRLGSDENAFTAGVSHDGRTLALRVVLSEPDKDDDDGASFIRLLDLQSGTFRDVIVSAYQLRAVARTEFERATRARRDGDGRAASAAFRRGADALEHLFERFRSDTRPGDRLALAAARAGRPPDASVSEDPEPR